MPSQGRRQRRLRRDHRAPIWPAIDPASDRSITEIEFDRAGERALERLCFLVDAKYPWPPDAIDYANHARLQAFRARIDQTLVRGLFTDKNDFALLLIQALTAWREEPAAGRRLPRATRACLARRSRPRRP